MTQIKANVHNPFLPWLSFDELSNLKPILRMLFKSYNKSTTAPESTFRAHDMRGSNTYLGTAYRKKHRINTTFKGIT